MRRFIILFFSMSALIAGLYGVRDLVADPPPDPSPGIDQVELERRIELFERRAPDPLTLTVLGQLYLHRARAGGGIDDYLRARDALVRATETYPDPLALTSLASAHLALHDFSLAKTAAQSALIHDRGLAALATLIDAEMALGGYETAGRLLIEMSLLIPSDPAYLVRRAQLSYLTGDIDAGVDLAGQAARASTSIGQPVADQVFYLLTAGRLQYAKGDYGSAERWLRDAMELDDRQPGVLLELGRVRSARGDLNEAIRLVERSVGLVPEPSSLALLGDLYLASGDDASARVQYDTIEVVSALGTTAFRLPVAAAYAGRGINTATALALAADELQARSDPITWHVYALTLYRSGQIDEAYEAIQRALGPADAPLLYHAGMIAAAHGSTGEAVGYLEAALRLSPRFHPIDADDARDLLRELRRP